MTSAAKSPYAGYRFPGEIISRAVWLYFRFPLSLRMVEEMLAARGIAVSHEAVRQWARKFGQDFANQIRRRLPGPGDKWHLDEVCLMIRRRRSTGSGGRWTRMASCSTFSSRSGGTSGRPTPAPQAAEAPNSHAESRVMIMDWA